MTTEGTKKEAAQAHSKETTTLAGMERRLGALGPLAGFWEGTGFSLIARPDFSSEAKNGIFLQLNALRESLEFTAIGAPVANRGSVQPDITINGLTYLHRVTDESSGCGLHIENGMWLNVPATNEPKANATVARLSVVPHGNSVCTTGFSQVAEFEGLPGIPPANSLPFEIDGKQPEFGTKNPYIEFDLSTPSAFRSSPLPASITQKIVDDPNQLLRDTLKRQVEEEGMTLKSITRLITSTEGGGIANIPFISRNADTPFFESVFAIEAVEDKQGGEFLQLQYSQTALINFRGMSFPHITVGTLTKGF